MIIRYLFATLLAISLIACTQSSQDPDVEGRALLAPFKADLKAALMQGMEGGPAGAIEVCRTAAPGIAEALSVDGVRMGRSSHRLRNPANTAPVWAAPIMESWVSDPGAREATTVDLPDGRQGYVEPITVQPLCLTCHGDNLAPDLAARIADLYPDDRATGFAEGDFRGVFWVEYPASE